MDVSFLCVHRDTASISASAFVSPGRINLLSWGHSQWTAEDARLWLSFLNAHTSWQNFGIVFNSIFLLSDAKTHILAI